MKITREDLNLLIDTARKEYIEISPNVCLPGTFKALTDGERIAMSWLAGAIMVLNKNGILDPLLIENNYSLDLEYNLPDCTTMTDGFDPDVEKDEPKQPA